MSLLFQNPAFLGLLALAAVPLLVHLISRAKPPEYRFPNVDFLRKAIATTARFKRPRDWILLLLRTLGVLALVAAFLHPLLVSENTALPGEKRSIVLLIDRSASMAAREDAASRFDAATARAAQILSDTRPDLANIVWIDSAPTAIFPEPAPNLDFLNGELARATSSPEPGAIDTAFQFAIRQLRDAPGRREIYIISDFQESAWENFSPVMPKDILLEMSPVARSSVANLAVTSLVPVPSSPVAGSQVVAQCRVANYSDEPRKISLTLDAGGSRLSKQLSLPPRGEAEAVFNIRVPAAGLVPLTAEIDADLFPGDDRRHAVIRVRESLRLAVAAPETDPTTVTLARIAGAIPWLEVIPNVSLDKLPPCEILCLPDWNGSDIDRLLKISETTALLVIPTSAWSDQTMGALLEAENRGTQSMLLESNPVGWEAVPSPDQLIFELFSGGEFGNPLAGKFRERIVFPGDLPGTILARFSDNKTAMLMAKNRPILVSALSLDPEKSTWPMEAPFLPAIGEILLHLAPQVAMENFSALAGAPLVWTDPAADGSTAPVLESPDSNKLALAGTGTTWKAETRAVPGIYRWLVSDQPVHFTAVNFPTTESDLAPMDSPPSVSGSTMNTDSSAAALLSSGLPLWPWLIAATLLCFLTESFVGVISTRQAPVAKI